MVQLFQPSEPRRRNIPGESHETAPYSDRRFDGRVQEVIAEWAVANPNLTILDVGAGAGMYAGLIAAVAPAAQVDALDADPGNVEAFGLRKQYRNVFVITIQDYLDMEAEASYDVILFGDVLEHLPKSNGLDVLNRAVYRCKHLIAVWPFNILLEDAADPLQRHVSVWGEGDFANFDHTYEERGIMRMVVARGFLDYQEAERT